jgi:tight adherence protein C
VSFSTIAAIAGLICASAIFLFCVRLDRSRAAAASVGNGDPSQRRARTPSSGSSSGAQKGLAQTLDRVGRRISGKRGLAARNDAVQVQLNLAGNPANLTPSAFRAIRVGAAALAIAAVLGVSLVLSPSMLALAEAAVAGALGYFLPSLVLRQLARSRRSQIEQNLPDAVDLLTLAVEAGLSLDAGMADVTSRFHNALGDEFAKVLREIRLGRPRTAALEDMGRRSGVPELHNLIQAITQSEQMGVGISRSLRMQAGELRRFRRGQAQEKAAQASLRMIFPMVGCIFPTIWIILLGPALLGVVKAWHG